MSDIKLLYSDTQVHGFSSEHIAQIHDLFSFFLKVDLDANPQVRDNSGTVCLQHGHVLSANGNGGIGGLAGLRGIGELHGGEVMATLGAQHTGLGLSIDGWSQGVFSLGLSVELNTTLEAHGPASEYVEKKSVVALHSHESDTLGKDLERPKLLADSGVGGGGGASHMHASSSNDIRLGTSGHFGAQTQI